MLTFDPADHWSVEMRETQIDEYDATKYAAMVADWEAAEQKKTAPVLQTEAAW